MLPLKILVVELLALEARQSVLKQHVREVLRAHDDEGVVEAWWWNFRGISGGARQM